MVRFIAFVLVLVGAGFAYEEYSGKSVGVKRTLGAAAGFVGLGEYGVATGATTPAFGGLGTVAKGAGGLAGSAARALGN